MADTVSSFGNYRCGELGRYAAIEDTLIDNNITVSATCDIKKSDHVERVFMIRFKACHRKLQKNKKKNTHFNYSFLGVTLVSFSFYSGVQTIHLMKCCVNFFQ